MGKEYLQPDIAEQWSAWVAILVLLIDWLCQNGIDSVIIKDDSYVVL